jgi:hypothetical protein
VRAALAALCLATPLIATSAAALEVHGESDVYAGNGVALAWAVLRGPNEAGTFVVVRVKAEPSIRTLAVKGIDPFTKSTRVWLENAPLSGRRDVRLPRVAFADFPNTEWQFFAEGKEPRLVVFYHGVPDTTPEFNDEGRLETYLEGRIANR